MNILIEPEIIEQLKKEVPITILSKKERQECIELYKKEGMPSAVKYINHLHPDLGLKLSKAYYDLYIKI